MIYNYNDQTLKSTQALIQAVIAGNVEEARTAIARGGNVNCRIIETPNQGYRVANPHELSETLRGEGSPETGGQDNPKKYELVAYEVPMVGTTTLLNLLATCQAARESVNNSALSVLLMDNHAELGGIDYASSWASWGPHPANYFQNTPLLNAIACQNISFAMLYMEYLQKLDEAPRKEILNYKDKFIAGFHTALEFAIRRGYSNLAISIIQAGADVNPQPFVYAYAGQSPLHMACMLYGNSKVKNGWNPKLGSDLDLIITLLEYGADYRLGVTTAVYDGIQKEAGGPPYIQKWKKINLTAFDHLDVSLVPDNSSIHRSHFDYLHACESPAFKPAQVGQIKHPFYEEECFLSPFASHAWGVKLRYRYLTSDEYQKIDKYRIQSALLQRIIRDYQKDLPGEDPIKKINHADKAVETAETVDTLLKHKHSAWFEERLKLAGILYTIEKNPTQLTPIALEENPLFNPAYRNKITRCSSNFYDLSLEPAIVAEDQPGDAGLLAIHGIFAEDPTQVISVSSIAVQLPQSNFD